MTVTMQQPIVNGNTVFLSWSSGLASPTFYVYRDGELVLTTGMLSVTQYIADGETPIFQVFDDPDDDPLPGYPGRVTLCWYACADTRTYRVAQYAGAGVWTELAEISDFGEPFFSWQSAWLPDSTDYQFRVVPVGGNGNDGTPVVVSGIMVRYPDPPSVTFVYSNTAHTLTISQA